MRLHSVLNRRSSFVAVVVTLAAIMLGSAPSTQAQSISDASVGYEVSTSGDYAVVGAQWLDGYKGAATILKRDGDSWVEHQALAPEDLGRFDHFGSTVAIDGDYVVVGAAWHDLLRGAVYVYKRNGDTWQLERKLTAAGAEPDLEFGRAVRIENKRITVATRTGAYEFDRQGDSWTERRSVASPLMQASGAALPDVVSYATRVYGQPPAAPSAAPDPPEDVSATDGVFEDRVEISWTHGGLDAAFYRVKRDGALISVVSSEDSLYMDKTGARGVTYN